MPNLEEDVYSTGWIHNLFVHPFKILLITFLLNTAKVYGIWINPQSTKYSASVIVQIDANERTLWWRQFRVLAENSFLSKSFLSLKYALVLNSECRSSLYHFCEFAGFSKANNLVSKSTLFSCFGGTEASPSGTRYYKTICYLKTKLLRLSVMKKSTSKANTKTILNGLFFLY